MGPDGRSPAPIRTPSRMSRARTRQLTSQAQARGKHMIRRHNGRHREASRVKRPGSFAAPPSASSPAPPRSALAGSASAAPDSTWDAVARLRERQQLVDQHRQRLLRRPAVLAVHLERLRRPGVRVARRSGHPRGADRGRRADPGRPGLGRLGLRLRRRRRGFDLAQRPVQQRLGGGRARRRRARPTTAGTIRPTARNDSSSNDESNSWDDRADRSWHHDSEEATTWTEESTPVVRR